MKLKTSRRASATVRKLRLSRSSHSSVREEALAHRVVVRVADRAHRLHDARLPAPLPEGQRRVLRALVAMMDHRARRLAAGDRHRQRIADQVGRHPQRHRPTDDPPTPHVEHHGEVQPSRPGAHLRDCRPPTVGRGPWPKSPGSPSNVRSRGRPPPAATSGCRPQGRQPGPGATTSKETRTRTGSRVLGIDQGTFHSWSRKHIRAITTSED